MLELSRRHLLAASAAFPALAALPSPSFAASSPLAPSPLDPLAEGLLRLSPGSATSLGIDNGARAALRAQLDDRSPAGRAKWADFLRTSLGALDRLAASRDVQVARFAFANGLEGYQLPYGDVAVGGWRNAPYVVIQNVGAYLDTPRLLDSDHQLKTVADAETWLARFAAFPAQLDGETEQLRLDRGRGVIAPDFLLDKALTQHRATAEAARLGAMIGNYAKATATFGDSWRAKAERIARDGVAPALDRQRAELERHRAQATGDAGVWKLPEGDRYYAWALKASTTTSLAPDELHRIGREQLRELSAQMDVILRNLGLTKGGVGARMAALGQDPRVRFKDGDPGRAEIIAFLTQQVAQARAAMPRAFTKLVPGNVEVKRLPPAEEPGAPAAYGGPGSLDGSIPGRMWINLGTTSRHTRYSLPTLVHHEAIPGHVWQGEYAQQASLIRALLQFNAYSEGWALYAEQLGDELGLYEGDELGRLGYLQSMAWRAIRLVVDTGLHAKRWTRAQAVQFFAEANGQNPEDLRSEVDRYCSWPGQACGYKVGHNEINRLRGLAQRRLGARYDFKAFNDAVVQGGNVPMPVLAQIVDAHVAARHS